MTGATWAQHIRRATTTALSKGRTGIQLTAVVLGAVLAGVVAYLLSDASGTWQQAVRDETIRSGAAQELTRKVYGDEAPIAFRIATAEARADALRSIQSPSIVADRVIADQALLAAGASAEPGTLATDLKYALPGGGFDVARRLAGLAEKQPGVPDPDRTTAEGDARARLAHIISGVTIVGTGIAVVAAAAPRRPTKRSPPPELIPQPGAADPRRRFTAAVLLALWAAGIVLPIVQLVLGGEEQRSQAAAARTAVQLSSQTAIGLARTGFKTNAVRDASLADAAAAARQSTALDTGAANGPVALAVARAEQLAASGIRQIADQMSHVPTADTGVSRYTIAALASGPNEWKTAGKVQESHAQRAEWYGAWSNGSVALIALVAGAAGVVQARPVKRKSSQGQRRRRARRARRAVEKPQGGTDVGDK